MVVVWNGTIDRERSTAQQQEVPPVSRGSTGRGPGRPRNPVAQGHQVWVMDFVAAHPGLAWKDIKALTGLSATAMASVMGCLLKYRLIERRGPRGAGRYYLIDGEEGDAA